MRNGRVYPYLPVLLLLILAVAGCEVSPTSPDADFDLPVSYAPAPLEEGFTLSSPDAPAGPPPFFTWGAGSPFYAGSASLWLNFPGSTAVLAREDGGEFNVLSMDFALQVFAPIASRVIVTGTQADGTTVSQELTIEPPAGPPPGDFVLQTFALVGFENLVELSWQQAVPGPVPHQFDNIDFEIPAAGPVTKDDCKKGGWEEFGFRNQGQCVRFIETGKDSR